MRFEISYRGGMTHEVDHRGTIAVLGRDPGCDIVLNDSKCSRRHAVVEDGPEGLWVRDTGSANGISVNGQRVDRAPLRPGDTLRLGEVTLKLLHDIGETVVVAPDDLQMRTAVGAPAPEAPAHEPASGAARPAASPRSFPPRPDPRRATAAPLGPRRPATVSLLAALWALFVPASVAAALLAAGRSDAGGLGWVLAAGASVVAAGLGSAMALGLRALAPWARHLQIAAAAVGLLACPVTPASATVLLYMTRPEVKAAFEERGGRAPGTNGRTDLTFALSILGMLVLGLGLAALAVSLA